MVKCPKCHYDLLTLVADTLEWRTQEVDVENGLMYWGFSTDIEGSCTKIEFRCPACAEILFENTGDTQDERVIEFLGGN